MSKVYSYMRFSAAKQADGASIARQTEYAKRWADENGMILDESLSMKDEGLSAYHQKHIKSGAFGAFLAAINAGKIPAGSVLIVEGLDRLSRTDAIDAQTQLTQIVNADITVVTASDGKQYNREKLKANPMELIYSFLVMIRAHEESQTKSNRVTDALRRKCEGWIAGTYRGRVSCGNDPAWVRWNGSGFELEPEMAGTMRQAIKMFTEGYGAPRILQSLTDDGRTITGGAQAGNLSRTLTHNPSLFKGDRKVTVNGVKYLLEGYYPALLSAVEHARLQLAIKGRKGEPRKAGGKSDYPSMITGLQIAVCGHCGNGVVTSNQTRPASYKGPQPIYRRIVCNICATAANKVRTPSSFAVASAQHIERAILDYCSDQFNLDALLSTNDSRTGELQIERAAILALIADNEAKLQRLVDVMLSDSNALPAALVVKMRELEATIAKDKAREKLIDAEISVAGFVPANASASAWLDIRDGVLSLDYDSRMKARRLVEETFSKIVVYFRGVHPSTGAPSVNILLTSKTSKTSEQRLLIVDRKTGKMLDAIKTNVTENDAAVVVSATKLMISGTKH